MPLKGVDLTPRPNLLTLEERKLILELFFELGVSKFRFTGGEPTLSNQLIELVSTVRNFQSRSTNTTTTTTSSSSSSLINGSKKPPTTIGITTNGTLLSAAYLRDLKDAGLDSINISLDTLNPTKFASITRRDSQRLNNVLSSIYTSLSLGLKVKVNCVLMKGTNEDELPAFVELSREFPLDVRFIELMPFAGNEWSRGKFMSYSEALLTIQGAGYDIQPTSPIVSSIRNGNRSISNESVVDDVDDSDVHDTTKWYHVSGHSGRVGFITSMTDDFCTGCNRLRITADGHLKVCLFGDESLSLRDHIRRIPSLSVSENIQLPLKSDLSSTTASTTTIKCNERKSELSVSPTTSDSSIRDDPMKTTVMPLRDRLTSVEVHSLCDVIGAAVFQKKAKLGGKMSPEDIASNTDRPMILIGG